MEAAVRGQWKNLKTKLGGYEPAKVSVMDSLDYSAIEVRVIALTYIFSFCFVVVGKPGSSIHFIALEQWCVQGQGTV